MLATITRVVDKISETVTAMRAKVSAHTPEGASAYRADYIHLSVPLSEYARLADQLAEARRIIEDDAERKEKLQRRITHLESSNGALMVDRQRGIDAAEKRARGAWQVAEDTLTALRAHDIAPGADLAALVEDANRYRHHYDKLMADERDRLDAFRRKIVGLIQACQDRAIAGRGLTPAEVGKLGRDIDRANDKARGR